MEPPCGLWCTAANRPPHQSAGHAQQFHTLALVGSRRASRAPRPSYSLVLRGPIRRRQAYKEKHSLLHHGLDLRGIPVFAARSTDSNEQRATHNRWWGTVLRAIILLTRVLFLRGQLHIQRRQQTNNKINIDTKRLRVPLQACTQLRPGSAPGQATQLTTQHDPTHLAAVLSKARGMCQHTSLATTPK